MRRAGPWRLGRRGNVAIEYALLLPALLLFLIGIMDTGRLLWTYTTLSRAVEAAARCGAINTNACATTAQIQSRAVTEAWGLNVTASAFTVSMPACGVKVNGTFDFVWAIPAVVSSTPVGTLTLSASACYSQKPSG